LSAAGLTRIADHLAGASACVARPSHGKESLLIAQLAAPLALPADAWSAAGCCPLAVTGDAGFKTANLDFSLCSEKSSLEVYGQIEAQIVAALLPRAALLASAGVEHFAKQIAEDIANIDAASKRTSAIDPAWPLRPACP